MPSTLPLSQPTAKPTTTSATAATRTAHIYAPSPYLYIHLTYHAPQTASPSSTASTDNDAAAAVDAITLRQALTAALRQHHGQHGAAIPIDILYVGASAPSSPCFSSASSSSYATSLAAAAAAAAAAASKSTTTTTTTTTHIIIRAPLGDGVAVVGACGAWVGETVSGGGRMGAGAGAGAGAAARDEDEAARSRWVVRGWDGALARLVLGDGKELFV